MLHSTTLLIALATSLLGASAAPQEILSPDNSITYYCPERETIDIAYMEYCPATSADGQLLTGSGTNVAYQDAPASFTTGANALVFTCQYENDEYCTWYAGGGEPMDDSQTNNEDYCPEISQVVPQPSPGVNYRRRSLRKRDLPAADFTCPFTSNTDVHLEQAMIARGSSTGGQGNLYICGLYGNDNVFYNCLYNEGGVLLTDSNNMSKCPRTACTPVTTSSGNMRRGVFVGDTPIVTRQARMDRLRRQLSAQ